MYSLPFFSREIKLKLFLIPVFKIYFKEQPDGCKGEVKGNNALYYPLKQALFPEHTFISVKGSPYRKLLKKHPGNPLS